MKKSTKNNNDNFLKKKSFDVTKHHKEYLGTDIPKDYFAKSKLAILHKVQEKKSDENFLRKDATNRTEHHKEYLGTTIPEGYFKQSKRSILNKVKEEQQKEVPKQAKVFWLQPRFRYAVAASLLFLLSLTIWLQNANNDQLEDNNIELLSFNDDVLVNSLFIEDDELETYTNTTLMNEVVIKAELSEQRMDDLILDSMILDDSLSEDKFIETIIL